MLETILCGFTEIVAENLSVEIERLEQKERDKSFTGFEIEYKVSCVLNHYFFKLTILVRTLAKSSSSPFQKHIDYSLVEGRMALDSTSDGQKNTCTN